MSGFFRYIKRGLNSNNVSVFFMCVCDSLMYVHIINIKWDTGTHNLFWIIVPFFFFPLTFFHSLLFVLHEPYDHYLFQAWKYFHKEAALMGKKCLKFLRLKELNFLSHYTKLCSHLKSTHTHSTARTNSVSSKVLSCCVSLCE